MKKLIFTRQGAAAYAAAPLCVFLLLAAFMQFAVADPFHAEAFAGLQPVIVVLMAMMAFSLSALPLLTRWFVLRLTDGRAPTGAGVLLCIPAALLMWFPAVLCAIPLYVLNLVWLARGQYPQGQPIRWQPALLLAVVLVGVAAFIGTAERHHRSQPAPTAEEAFLRQAQAAEGILAQLPQEDGSVLMISLGACGVVEETADGWVLREAYKGRNEIISDEKNVFHAFINRSQTGEIDVAVVWKVVFDSQDSPEAAAPPRDSVGSEFTLVTADEGIAVSYYYYALVDVDAPGYELYPE